MTGTRSFTNFYDGRSNSLKSYIGVTESGKPFGEPLALPWVGVWDTGATGCVLSQRIVDALNLKPIDQAIITTPTSVEHTLIYSVDIALPSKMIIPLIRACVGKLVDFDILVGMDIISLGDFAVSNLDGKTAFSFRIPSLVKFDFTKNSYIPPNSPCYCGSGRKYKHCHGKN